MKQLSCRFEMLITPEQNGVFCTTSSMNANKRNRLISKEKKQWQIDKQ